MSDRTYDGMWWLCTDYQKQLKGRKLEVDQNTHIMKMYEQKATEKYMI